MDLHTAERRAFLGSWQNWIVLLVAALAALPSLPMASMYTLAFRAMLWVGHWPHYGSPDASTLPDHFHPQSEPLETFVPVGVYVLCVGLFATLVFRFAHGLKRVFYALFAGAITWLLFIGLFLSDPAGVWMWIMD
jgi:hypothetical protein